MAKKNRQKKATRLAKRSGLTPGTGARAKHSTAVSSTRTGRLKRARGDDSSSDNESSFSHQSADSEEDGKGGAPSAKAKAKVRSEVDKFLNSGFLQQLEDASSDEDSGDSASADHLASDSASADSEEKPKAKKSDTKSKDKDDKKNDKKGTSKKGKVAQLESSIESHQAELEALKEKDPEFFKFLQENDAGLLDFGNDDDDDDDAGSDGSDGDDDDADDDAGTAKKADKPEKAKTSKSGATILTAAMLDQWEASALKGNRGGVKRILRAFRSAARSTEKLEGDSKSREADLEIPSSDLFHRVMQFAVTNIGNIFDLMIGYDRKPMQVKTGERRRETMPLPSQNAKFKSIAALVKSFLANLFQFMSDVSEPEMIAFLIRASGDSLLPYIVTNNLLARKYLKLLVSVWTTSAESTRVQAFIVLRKLALNAPYPFIDQCIKAVYLGYVRNAKFTNAKTLPAITFMSNCVTELMGVDLQVTYQHAFSYIRQLAIHLRNAINTKSKESHQNVYSWQFINSLKCWVSVLSRYADSGELQPLVYPLTQVIIGTIQLVPTTRYFPLRFHCARMLNDLSRAADTYVPLAPLILEVLDSAELKKKPKPSTAKPLILHLALKASDSVISTPSYHANIVKESLSILLDHFAIYAYSITFPELTLPTVVLLKSKLKDIKAPKLKKEISLFIERLKRNENFILTKRSGVDFAPKDLKQVRMFEQQGGEGKTAGIAPLLQYHSVQQNLKESKTGKGSMLASDIYDSEEENEDDEDTRPKKKAKTASDASASKKKKPDNRTTAETVTPRANEEAGDDEVFEMEDVFSDDDSSDGSESSS
eukprot:TRINITY_DN5292_c0_g1_i3.p1 TRINITY_DN5292_c0_g1~~TRINITY_DN5292_c0_g1_i3.p1  ORF type:complete len:823 (-),score=265.12 TRINITY_DN5292_c0_g1_i3:127-2595(-)